MLHVQMYAKTKFVITMALPSSADSFCSQNGVTSWLFTHECLYIICWLFHVCNLSYKTNICSCCQLITQ